MINSISGLECGFLIQCGFVDILIAHLNSMWFYRHQAVIQGPRLLPSLHSFFLEFLSILFTWEKSVRLVQGYIYGPVLEVATYVHFIFH